MANTTAEDHESVYNIRFSLVVGMHLDELILPRSCTHGGRNSRSSAFVGSILGGTRSGEPHSRSGTQSMGITVSASIHPLVPEGIRLPLAPNSANGGRPVGSRGGARCRAERLVDHTHKA